MSKKDIKILHLTDLHLYPTSTDPKFVIKPTAYKWISSGIKEVLSENQVINIDYVVITGDFTWNAKLDQYKHAISFLIDLFKNLGFTNANKLIILPGNHDIDRDLEQVYRLDEYKEFYRNLYEDNYWVTKFSGNMKARNNGQEIITYFEDDDILFIPLSTPNEKADILPETLKKVLGNIQLKEKWAFDCGIVRNEQKSKIGKELKDESYNTSLKIALMHHNPLPIKRGAVLAEDNDFVETNMLCNGTEILKFLYNAGVKFVLHGHRHQDSIISFADMSQSEKGLQRQMYILGAPSLGQYEASSAYNDHIGFYIYNMETTKDKLNVLEFKGKLDDGIKWESNKRVFDLSDKKTIQHSSYLIDFKKGLEKFGELLLKADGGVSILHYYPHTNWQYCYNELWNGLIKDKVITSLLRRDSPNLNRFFKKQNISEDKVYDKINLIRDIIIRSIAEQRFTKELIDFFNILEIQSIIKGTINGSVKQCAFSNGLLDNMQTLLDVKGRNSFYTIEHFKCALDSKYFFHRAICFQNSIDGVDATDTNEVKDKFNWIIESVIKAKNLSNFHLAWLPYTINKYEGNSLVSSVYSITHPTDSIHTELLIGFRDIEDAMTVLHLGEYSNDEAFNIVGNVYSNLNALMRKIIYPLTIRLLDDFPLYKDGKVFINHFKMIMKMFGVEDMIIDMEDKFKDFEPGRIETINNITHEKLLHLFFWGICANGLSRRQAQHETKEETLAEKLSIPWKKSDKEELLSRINENVTEVIEN